MVLPTRSEFPRRSSENFQCCPFESEKLSNIGILPQEEYSTTLPSSDNKIRISKKPPILSSSDTPNLPPPVSPKLVLEVKTSHENCSKMMDSSKPIGKNVPDPKKKSYKSKEKNKKRGVGDN